MPVEGPVKYGGWHFLLLHPLLPSMCTTEPVLCPHQCLGKGDRAIAPTKGPGHTLRGLQGAPPRSLSWALRSAAVVGRRPILKPPGSAGPPLRRCSQAGSCRERPPPYTCRAAHRFFLSPPVRGRTPNPGQAQRPHVRLSVHRFPCDHGSARPAPATAGAGLKQGGGFPESGGGTRGGPCPAPPRAGEEPEPRRSPTGAPPEPGLRPSQSRHQRNRNRGPCAPAAPEPRPVSPAGAALRGSLGRGV